MEAIDRRDCTDHVACQRGLSRGTRSRKAGRLRRDSYFCLLVCDFQLSRVFSISAAAATTGTVQVGTPSGTLSTNTAFLVRP